ncbi:MAG: hypothetical protein ACKVVP_11975 [Chloroflexota bacterium]
MTIGIESQFGTGHMDNHELAGWSASEQVTGFVDQLLETPDHIRRQGRAELLGCTATA